MDIKKEIEYIKVNNLLSKDNSYFIQLGSNWKNDYHKIYKVFNNKYNISCTMDLDIIKPYLQDWSNIPGHAIMLTRPKTEAECAIILKTCFYCKIPITISAGQTNLTGSSTPKGGIILSTSLLINPEIKIDNDSKHITSPAGIPLEDLRNKILKLTKNKYYYPVNPTSRYDALVGGTISCNASGFIPGEKGATRYWVDGLTFLLPNGNQIKATRGQYVSENGFFKLKDNNQIIILPVPTYKRPNIKNASGLFSSIDGNIDLVDLIIGSEGILGLVTSCKLRLSKRPNDYLELFICLESEIKAIELHDYLIEYYHGDLGQISALEYFGYNSQKYMKHRKFLFKNETDVGVYVQVPIYNGTVEIKSMEWVSILSNFDYQIDTNSIIVLNDPLNWKFFFEARHSIPDNALTKTKSLGGISIITDTIVPPSNYRLYLNKIHNKLKSVNIEYLLFGHLGDCHLHFHLIPKKNQDDLLLEIYDYMIDLSSALGGVYSAEHGTGKRKRNDFRKCYGNKAVAMIQSLKQTIDPNFLLNRGNIIQPL